MSCFLGNKISIECQKPTYALFTDENMTNYFFGSKEPQILHADMRKSIYPHGILFRVTWSLLSVTFRKKS